MQTHAIERPQPARPETSAPHVRSLVERRLTRGVIAPEAGSARSSRCPTSRLAPALAEADGAACSALVSETAIADHGAPGGPAPRRRHAPAPGRRASSTDRQGPEQAQDEPPGPPPRRIRLLTHPRTVKGSGHMVSRVVIAEDEAIILPRPQGEPSRRRATRSSVRARSSATRPAAARQGAHAPDLAILDIKMPGLDGAGRRHARSRGAAGPPSSSSPAFSQQDLHRAGPRRRAPLAVPREAVQRSRADPGQRKVALGRFRDDAGPVRPGTR